MEKLSISTPHRRPRVRPSDCGSLRMEEAMRTRRTVFIAVITLFAVSIALASSAHFNSCSKSSQGNNLVVSFKEVGLGNDVTCISVSARADATYACFNGGNKNPSAANKRTISEDRVAS